MGRSIGRVGGWMDSIDDRRMRVREAAGGVNGRVVAAGGAMEQIERSVDVLALLLPAFCCVDQCLNRSMMRVI